jgi:hypothetical protein
LIIRESVFMHLHFVRKFTHNLDFELIILYQLASRHKRPMNTYKNID